MAYSGKFKPKNPNKYKGDSSNIIFRSLWERACFKWCDETSTVKSWSSEEVVVPYLYEVDKKAHRYFVDLKINYTNGETHLVEIKPHKETSPPTYPGKRTKKYINESLTYIKNQNKWEAATSFAKDRGWQFVVWTEKDLQRMGILHKSIKPLPPFRGKKRDSKNKK